MAGVAGIFTSADLDYALVNTLGQQAVYDAVDEYLRVWNEKTMAMMSIFVQQKTSDFKFKHYLPGGGEMQQLGRQAPAAAGKPYGSYDVALQLRDYGHEIAGSRLDMAYMTVSKLKAALKDAQLRYLASLRRRIMTAIFEDTQYTFDDPVHGNLTVEHLANGDAVVYPPVHGSETEATEDHYLYTGYDVADIATSSEPVATCVADLAQHFGGVGSRGREFIYFHNTDQTPFLQAMTAAPESYVPVTDRFIQAGANTAEVFGIPNGVPGRIHGRMSGAWLSEWPSGVPALYGVLVLMGVPAPLYMRIHPTDVGLGDGGLHLVAHDENYPMERSSFEASFGVGVVNRLNAVAIEISEDGAYSPPTGYAEP